MKITKNYLKELTYEINGAAIEVHKALDPGLLESVYHECMMHELELRGIPYETEMIAPVNYKGLKTQGRLRCDLFIENSIAVELKAVKKFEPIFDAELMTYMKLLKAPKGILYNFNVINLFREGQKTFVNELFRDLPD
ncbi:MAG: GxxExxY protein [Bacteroidota bacterium]